MSPRYTTRDAVAEDIPAMTAIFDEAVAEGQQNWDRTFAHSEHLEWLEGQQMHVYPVRLLIYRANTC